VKLNFIDGAVNGIYDLDSGDNFETMMNDAVNKCIVLRGKKILLVYPAIKLRQVLKTTGGAQMMLKMYDSIVTLEESLQGHFLGKYATGGHRNRMLIRASNSFMWAGAYEVGINTNSLTDVLSPSNYLNNLWGPAHEIGHCNQIAKGFKWVGMAEVSNNVCSAYVQHVLNGGKDKNYLKGNSYGGNENGYSRHNYYYMGYRDIVIAGRSHFAIGSESNGQDLFFIKLVPFWQLWLYYQYVGDNPDFYPTIYGTIRQRADNQTITDGQAQVNFVKIACDAAGEDLTDYFKSWGVLKATSGAFISDYGGATMTITQEMVDEVYAYVRSKGYPKPKYNPLFVNEGNLDTYVAGKTPVAGSFTINSSSRTYNCTGFDGVVMYELTDSDDNTLIYSLTPTIRYTTCEYSWQNRDGVVSATNSVNYNIAHKGAVVLQPTNDTYKVYGITPQGERIAATNNPK
jgi:hypothetical protein